MNNGLNPLRHDAQTDFDLDGLSNIQEWVAGTQANNPDTDGDTIPDGADLAPLFNMTALLPTLLMLLE